MIRIAIVDDHQLFNEGLKTLLETFSEYAVCGQFNDGPAFLEKLADLKPDVVLMDIDMPGMNGFQTAQKARLLHPEIKVIMLSMHNDYASIDEGLKIGINGYLPKNVDKQELNTAIETVVSGKDFFTDAIKNTIISGHRSPHTQQQVVLTPREKDILCLISEELSSQEISERLFISVNTVETHRKNLLVKTGCKNSVGLVKFAIENKICASR
jgi:DNA-binding NarL/FixJ family response regulator